MQPQLSDPARDPLASLRIDRSMPIRERRSTGIWKWLLALVLLLVISGIGYFAAERSGWLSNNTGNGGSGWLSVPDIIKTRPEVRVVKVTIESGRSADATVVATGYLESRRQAKIGARAPGRIKVVNVEEGSRVAVDEVLAILEHADLDASLAATEASVARATAALSEQKIVIEQNRREYDRMKSLFASRSISDSEYDQARFQYEGAVARLESMKADVRLAEARLNEARQLKENMFIRAPFDGTVISKDAEVGESILPGGMGEASGRGSVVTIADLEHLEVDCDVKEDYISRIHEGHSAEVAVDAVPDRRYHGVVRKVIPMGDRARATIKVKVSITDVDSRLFPDMSSTVYFLSDAKLTDSAADKPRMFCPESAVVEDDAGDFVWTVDEADHAIAIRVETGVAKDGRIEILGGLSGDERIVSKPPKLEAKQAVKIAE